MKTKMGFIGECDIKGFTIRTNGQLIHLRDIKKETAFEQAKIYGNVEWVRPFTIRGGWRVIGV